MTTRGAGNGTTGPIIRFSRTPLPMALEVRDSELAANTSANSARDCLKPLVFALAILFAVTLRSSDAALRPLRAILNGMVSPS